MLSAAAHKMMRFWLLFFVTLIVSTSCQFRRPAAHLKTKEVGLRFESCLERLTRIDSCQLRTFCKDQTEERTKAILLDKSYLGTCPDVDSKLDDIKYDKPEEDPCACAYCDGAGVSHYEFCLLDIHLLFLILFVASEQG